MSSARQQEFPQASIGRTQGARLQQATHDAHPLLSGTTSPTTSGELHAHMSSSGVAGSSSGSPSSAKYVPYTPRQRAPQTAATNTTVHPPSPQQHMGDATSKLQMMNLKAAAQGIGLDMGTVGWAILEKLMQECGGAGENAAGVSEEWVEIWSALTVGKATLLLPLDQASLHEKITPDFVKDHIVLCDGPSRNNSQFVTLSGLRGVLNDTTLTFRSTLHPSNKLFQDLLSPTSRTSGISHLPPLPLPLPEMPVANYPSFTLPSYILALPLPPRSHLDSQKIKPPLPPRPAGRSVSVPISTPAVAATTPAAPTASRIPNPFASLFGRPTTPAPNPAPVAPIIIPSVAAAVASTSSPAASIHSTDSFAHPPSSESITEISAFTISRKIVFKDLAKEVTKTLRNEVKDALNACAPLSLGNNIGVPGWVVERVEDITKDWGPFVKAPPPAAGSKGGGRGGVAKRIGLVLEKNNLQNQTSSGGSSAGKEASGGKEKDAKQYIVNLFTEPPEETAEKLQDFYMTLEQDMRAGGTPFLPKRRERESKEKDREGDEKDGGGLNEKEPTMTEEEKREQEKMQGETRIRGVMDAVERTVCSLFYDRLFLQPTTDDAMHDEALSSRVAALNMLDLTLEHLDIVGGDASPELDLVVRACGDMLSQLESCRCPADKAAILVAAHKIVVDGLSRLPPIKLKSEEDSAASPVKENEVLVHAKEALSPHEDDLLTARPADMSSSNFPVEHADGPLEPAIHPKTPIIISQSESSLPTTGPSQFSLPEDDAEQASAPGTPAKQRPPPLPLGRQSVSPSPLLKPIPLPIQAPKATPVSGDVLLPMIIFSVVKSNPPHLVSNLLYTQRFRNQGVGGEESYCLINLMAVAEFLENVDLAALGLGDSDKVLSTADLTPIPLTRTPVTSETPLPSTEGLPGSLRGRVEQQVDAIADSANKVISGVVDSSFGILRSFLPNNTATPAPADSGTPTLEAAPSRPGFGLLRRESGFSIASLAASLPITGRKSHGTGEEEESGQQLVTVSRAGSTYSRSRAGSVASGLKIKVDDADESEVSESETTGTEDEDGQEGEDEDEDEDDEADEELGAGDARSVRSIRSFESMMKKGTQKHKKVSSARKTLSDRLAHMSALAGFKGTSPPGATGKATHPPESPESSRPPSPTPLKLAPPIQRFVDCTPDDLRLSEIGELLRDYRRLVEGIRSVGGFEE